MTNIGENLLLGPFRGADSNKNTDINTGDYHVVDNAADIAVISSAFVDVHAFYFCVTVLLVLKSYRRAFRPFLSLSCLYFDITMFYGGIL